VDGAAVSLWGTRVVGVARGRGVAWDPIDVLANGERVVGLSLFAARDDGFGAKIVCPDRRFDLGETRPSRSRSRRATTRSDSV